MGKATGIAWCDSTRNFWTGCTKVGPGCDFCYAELFSRFARGLNRETGEANNWGPGAPRVPHLDGAAKDLRRWNRQAAAEIDAGKRDAWRVFVNSHSDIFDNEVPDAWREYAFSIMRECTALTFLLVTKRIGNALPMLPRDWGSGYPNVWLLATVVNQDEYDRDIEKLAALPAIVTGLSVEPMLNPLYFRFRPGFVPVDWVIFGGESGVHARPCGVDWIRDGVEQCRSAGVAPFVKQLGARAVTVERDEWKRLPLLDDAGADIEEWPADLRIQEYPQ